MNYNYTCYQLGEQPGRMQRTVRGPAAPLCDPPELGLPIAMAYVPWQQWGETYPCDMALCRGTLFPCLDLPYKGAPRRRCCNG